jgi:hypothetical protein
MFSFPFVQGDFKTALQSHDSLIVTDKIAEKYFGGENPIGKVIILNNRQNLTVRGVIHVPRNSHLQFGFIAFLPNRMDTNWNWADPSYVLLKPATDIPKFEEKIAGSLMSKYPGKLPAGDLRVGILPITKVYLGFGRQTYVTVFSLIAGFILLMACFNYMNLATTASSSRAKEVGMRKVVGAKRGQLIQQFLGESLMITTVSLLLSLLAVKFALPILNNLTAKQLEFNIFQNPFLLVFFLLIILVVGAAAGTYPAFFLSASKPVDTLKTSQIKRRRGSSFRVMTVVGQFAISILLIACTAVVLKQLNYIQNRPLGFSTEYVVKVPINSTLLMRIGSYKNTLMQNPDVLNVTASIAPPYDNDYKTSGVDWDGKLPDLVPNFRYTISFFDYFQTFDMDMAEGRSFRSGSSADVTNYVVNEKAAEYMGMNDPVGQRLTFWGTEGTIIGVVKNYHHVPLHREIMPHVFSVNTRNFNMMRFLFIKIAGQNVPATLKHIRDVTRQMAPDFPYSYSFLDEGLNALYQAEQRLGKIIGAFAFLAVFISCLGIFGLASFTAEKRTKEIGIRKVLGSSSSGIVFLLSRDFSKWILLANVLAWPIGWFLMSRWLSGFAYRTGLNLPLFMLAGALSLAVAAIPVVYFSLKAALTDPVHTLRYE